MSSLAERARPVLRVEYERMIQAGLFRKERVELIRGIIVRASPQDSPHATVVQILTRLLVPALVARADVRVQLPFSAGVDSMPEPDLAVVDVATFAAPHPDRAHLIIEVADSSLDDDRHVKGPLYAEVGVKEYWVVNVAARVVEVHTEPSHGGYLRVTPFRSGERITLSAFPDVVIDVQMLFA